MKSNVVKCNNCNIVICEVLAFIQNKCGVMDEEGLVRICASSFTAEEIESAKNLLFDAVPTQTRNITRKREGKAQRDLVDIIYLMKNTSTDNIPIFVARQLHRLPPVTWDHIDTTRLLKDIMILKEEMNLLRENCATSEQIQEVRNELEVLKNSSIVNNFEYNINTKRGASKLLSNTYSYDSGPIGMTHIEMNKCNSITNDDDAYLQRSSCEANGRVDFGTEGTSISSADIVPALAQMHPNSKPVMMSETETATVGTTAEESSDKKSLTDAQAVLIANERPSTTKHTKRPNTMTLFNKQVNKVVEPHVDGKQVSPRPRTMAEIVSTGIWKPEIPSEQWKEVIKRKYKNRFVGRVGKAQTNSHTKFRAADNKTELFISNVHTDTSVEDISEYIFETTQLNVTLEKIPMKKQKKHNSYKFSVPSHKLRLFLDDNLWPDGISFRKFIHFRPRKNEENVSQIYNG